MAWQFARVAGPFSFTEGPVWVGDAVLFTDIPSSRIMRYDHTTGACTVFASHTNEANGLTRDRQGRLYACEGGVYTGIGRCVVRYEADGRREVLAAHYQNHRLNEPNDIVVDSRDRIWFSDPCYGDPAKQELDHESVYRLDPLVEGGYTITRVTFDTVRPNGLALSPDERTLYVAECTMPPGGERPLRAYPVYDDGNLGSCRLLYDFGPHRAIDGMRVADDGCIVATAGWQQSGPGPRIVVFSPDGEVIEEHPLPSDPTNCCFGDADGQSLYVTCYDGALYRARTDRRAAVTPEHV